SQLFGRALRVAAGHQDAGGVVLAMDAPHGLAYVAIGLGRHGAGVEHYQVGLGAMLSSGESFAREQRFERRAVSLGGPAAEVLDEESTHWSYSKWLLVVSCWLLAVLAEASGKQPTTDNRLSELQFAVGTELAEWGVLENVLGHQFVSHRIAMYDRGGQN